MKSTAGRDDQRQENLSLLLDYYHQTGDLFVIDNLLAISSACQEISCFYHEYDLPPVQGNGFRSFVRKCDFLFENMKKLVQTGEKSDILLGYERLTQTFVKQIQVLKLIREKDEYGHNDKRVFNAKDAAIIHSLIKFADEDIKPLYTTPGAFWLDNMIADMSKSLMHTIVFVNSSWSEKVKLMVSRSVFADHVVQMVQNFDVDSIREISNIGTIFPFNTLCAIAKYVHGTRIEHMMVERRNQWTFELDGPEESVKFERSGIFSTRVDPVKCLFVRPDSRTSDTLIFHLHGSGYVAMRPGDHESYLREWSRELGVTVIAPDYAKAPEKPYPCGLQDVLDVYLSTTGSSDFFGFKPGKVIITGDSAGGYLAIALVFALNEIRSQGHYVHMPHGLCLQCPVSCPITYAASTAQTCLDTFLPTSMALTVATSYSETTVPLESRWYRRPGLDVKGVEEGLRRFAARITDPYFNLMAYDKWSELSDIPLMMQTGEFDPVLDCSIDIGRKWGGKVTFDVMQRMPHSFLLMMTARKEAAFVIQRLRQLIDPKGETTDCGTEEKSLVVPKSLVTVLQRYTNIV